MRERTHGHVGIDLSGSGEQEARRAVRPSRRGASGPRPVRPPVAQAVPHPAAGLAAPRRPAIEPGGPDRRGVRGAGGSGAAVAAAVEGVPAGRCRAASMPPDAVAAVGVAGVVVAPRGERVRRALAGLALVLAAAAVVVGLGRVADLTAQARAVDAPAVAHAVVPSDASGAVEIIVTVAAPGTVWDVADGVAPGASGPQRAALVDRIVAANALTSLRVSPGEVLRVPLRGDRPAG